MFSNRNRLVSVCVLLPVDADPPAELETSLLPPVAPSVFDALFAPEVALVVVAVGAAEAEGLAEGTGALPVVFCGGAAGCPPPGSMRAGEAVMRCTRSV